MIYKLTVKEEKTIHMESQKFSISSKKRNLWGILADSYKKPGPFKISALEHKYVVNTAKRMFLYLQLPSNQSIHQPFQQKRQGNVQLHSVH